MPQKKITKKKNPDKVWISVLVFLFNSLVLLGLVILYPFEFIVCKFREVQKSFVQAVVQKQKAFIKRFDEVYASVISYAKRIHDKSTTLVKSKPVKSARPRTVKSRYPFLTTLKHFTYGVIFATLFIFIPFQAYSWYKQLPRPELLTKLETKSTRILDRNGRFLYEVYVDKKYDPVTLEEIPNHVIQATLAIEDDNFYNHYGIDPVSMLRAAKETLFDDNLQGGSTITQQLVKVTLLSPERTVSRKVKEVFLALSVEHQYTKNKILELYLNNIPYGGTAWGIQSASQKFFNKDVADLSLAEASLLAGLPSAPTLYSPIDGGYESAKARQRLVLDRMVELGYITETSAMLAYNEELSFAPQIEYIRAPHFVHYVIDELVTKYGRRYVDFGGLTVTTTLDLDLHDKVQEIVTKQVAENEQLQISNGAAVVLDVDTGGILAYVGSVDYFEDESGAFDVVRAPRSPGSSIKAVTYALALSSGYTPASTIKDAPFTVQKYGQTYSPKNYDGKFHGTVTIRQALANSYNIPAVKYLQKLGIENMVNLGKAMGITTWELDSSYGLALTLGSKEVRLIDLANVYTTLARYGIQKDTTPFVSIKDSNGFEVYKDDRTENAVLNAGVAYLITDILSDNRARTPTFGSRSSLYIPDRSIAVKTGTSDDKRDNLTIGYTPSFVVAVWVGNNDYSPMHKYLASGLSGASPIWNEIIKTLLGDSENEPFSRPNSVFVKMDKTCGRSEIFLEGTVPAYLCPKEKDEEKKANDNSKNDRG